MWTSRFFFCRSAICWLVIEWIDTYCAFEGHKSLSSPGISGYHREAYDRSLYGSKSMHCE